MGRRRPARHAVGWGASHPGRETGGADRSAKPAATYVPRAAFHSNRSDNFVPHARSSLPPRRRMRGIVKGTLSKENSSVRLEDAKTGKRIP